MKSARTLRVSGPSLFRVLTILLVTGVFCSAGAIFTGSANTQSANKAGDQDSAGGTAAPQNGKRSGNKKGIKVRPTDVAGLPSSAKRYALIIGIDQYDDTDISSLTGAVRDARSLKQALVSRCQFNDDNVIVMTSDAHDRNLKPTRSNIIYKLSTLEGLVPPDGLLLFAFSGHGVEVDNQAFLLPMESKLSRDTLYLSDNAISVDRIKEYVKKTGVKQRILLLDACRNKLTSAKGIDVAPMSDSYQKAFDFDAEKKNRSIDAFLTFYATEKGQESWEDPDTGQGYFTEAIVEALNGGRNGETLNAEGEVTLGALTKYVRDAVADRTKRMGKVQVPHPVIDGYGNDLILAKVEVKRPPVESTVAVPSNPVLVTDMNAATEIAYWTTIADKTDPELFKAYLSQYPNGKFVKLAGTLLKDLEAPYWSSIAGSTDPAAFKTYCDIYPDGRFVSNARAAMQKLEDGYWKNASSPADPKALNSYLALYPDGTYAKNAKELLNAKTDAAGPNVKPVEVKAASAGLSTEPNSAAAQPASPQPASAQPAPPRPAPPRTASRPVPPDVHADFTAAVPGPFAAVNPLAVDSVAEAAPPATEVLKPAVNPTAPAAAGAPVRAFQFNTLKFGPNGTVVEKTQGHGNYFADDLNSVVLKMVEVPAGSFQMGSAGPVDERPAHKVALQSFFMGEFEITQAQWRAVAKLPKVKIDLVPDPSYYKGGDLPVTNVSWEEAVEFCARLSKLTGRQYRLPTEAEWEYACRAGSTTAFSFGDNVSANYVNFDGEHPYQSDVKGQRRLQPVYVGSLGVANAFGLYDLHGNAGEWCSDVWHDSYDQAPVDGSSWDAGGDGAKRVVRGGDWTTPASRARSSARIGVPKTSKSFTQGFRVVLEASSIKPGPQP